MDDDEVEESPVRPRRRRGAEGGGKQRKRGAEGGDKQRKRGAARRKPQPSVRAKRVAMSDDEESEEEEEEARSSEAGP